jgi:hypothetical protein
MCSIVNRDPPPTTNRQNRSHQSNRNCEEPVSGAGDLQATFVMATATLSLTAATIQVWHEHRSSEAADDGHKKRLKAFDRLRKWFTLAAAICGASTIPLTLVKGADNARLLAEANARAEEARALAETERLERVRLEDRIRPRTITRPDLLAASVSAFHSLTRQLSIECDSDQLPIANTIMSTIHAAAGWGVGEGWSEDRRLPPGMVLYVASNADATDWEIARALARGLVAAGAADLEGPVTGHPTDVADVYKIVLMIGAKK